MPIRHSKEQQGPAGIRVALANEQTAHAVVEAQLVAAVEAVIRDSAFSSAEISVAVVDDATMHALNRQYLDHDYPTDVLSFVLETADGHLAGEVILSADMAATCAAEQDWPAEAEQLLYVIHGTLHLIGYRDKQPAEIEQMRAAEHRYLKLFGFEPVGAASVPLNAAPSAGTAPVRDGAAGP